MKVESTFCAAAVAPMVTAACVPSESDEEAVMAQQRLDNGSFTAEINDHTIHYEIHGEGPVFDGREQVGLITTRCLVVAGGHDNFPAQAVRELHDGLANSAFVLFASSGHSAPLEEARLFQETMLVFWEVH